MVLCGASIFNAFLRGEPWQIVVSPTEAVKVLEEAAPICQRSLDQLASVLLPAKGKDAAVEAGAGAGGHLPFYTRSGFCYLLRIYM